MDATSIFALYVDFLLVDILALHRVQKMYLTSASSGLYAHSAEE